MERSSDSPLPQSKIDTHPRVQALSPIAREVYLDLVQHASPDGSVVHKRVQRWLDKPVHSKAFHELMERSLFGTESSDEHYIVLPQTLDQADLFAAGREAESLPTGQGIGAIETEYNGIRFRSRLEARWSIFFDHLNVSHSYEYEAYKLDEKTVYLPDFWLPDQKLFVEIKPQYPSRAEAYKCTRLSEVVRGRVACCIGDPMRQFQTIDYSEPWEARVSGIMFHCNTSYQGHVESHLDENGCYWWCECPVCSAVDLSFEGGSDAVYCGHRVSKGGLDRVKQAAQAARSHRFWR